MAGMFVVIVKKTITTGRDDRIKCYGDRMTCYGDEPEVLRFIGTIGQNAGDPRTVERVFEVDEFGRVTFYEIVFDGKLKLEAQPRVKQG